MAEPLFMGRMRTAAQGLPVRRLSKVVRWLGKREDEEGFLKAVTARAESICILQQYHGCQIEIGSVSILPGLKSDGGCDSFGGL